ncbi:MAG: trehalase family glycosidase [Steroidobacter sp.]
MLTIIWTIATTHAAPAEYVAVQNRLQRGWNTWDTNTVIGHVLLPQGLEIRLGIKRNSSENSDAFLGTALIGRQGKDDEQVFPGPHSFDGSYTELRLRWRGVELKVQTAHVAEDLVMLVTPVSNGTTQSPTAVISAGMLWNQPGVVTREEDALIARMSNQQIPIFATERETNASTAPLTGPYFALRLDHAVGISTGKRRDVKEIESIVTEAQRAFADRSMKSGATGEIRGAIETVLGWDTIYDPSNKRVLSPVSRIWNQNWGGYVVFDWDTFFAASMAAIDNRDLAYANAIEVLNETTSAGFVPNYSRAAGWKSSDRSEPPVGSITILALYRRFHDRWFLDATYERLLKWNEWWPRNRDVRGYLVWGSDPDAEPRNPDDSSVGTLQGARYESGLDNSPMYDHVGFDGRLMQLADVGLMGLYIADCDALATIALELGHRADATKLQARANRYRKSLKTLWDEKSHIYRNKDLRNNELSASISPTLFYPLLAKAPNAEQVDAMLRDHLLNPNEFWGERVIPSITRNDKAFADQDYWRGRIWGPMNYLVWLGLNNYNTPLAQSARRQLAERSAALFLEEWRTKGHVHENYSAVGPDSDTVTTSDRFYHWGALLGLIAMPDQP